MSREGKNKTILPELSDRQSLWFWIILAVTLIILTAFFAVSCSRNVLSGPDPGIAPSVIRRTKLKEGAVTETAYYTDHLDWLGKNNEQALKGLRYFYRQTGVQPYVFLTNNLGLDAEEPTEEALTAYAESLYESLFQDEGHLLLVIYENRRSGNGILSGCTVGSEAAAVMDEDAVSILTAYLKAALADGTRYPQDERDRMLSDVFQNTAKNIMAVRDRSGWVIALAVLLTFTVTFILVDFAKAWQAAKKQEEAEKQEKSAAAR